MLALPVADMGITKGFTLVQGDRGGFKKELGKLKRVQPVKYLKKDKAIQNSSGIYIYRSRTADLEGGTQKALVYINGRKIAAIGGRQYVVIPLKPGKYQVALRSDMTAAKTRLNVTLKPNQELFYDLSGQPGHAAATLVFPLASMGVSKAFKYTPANRKDFETSKAKMGRVLTIRR